jgi:hypothetical protein
MTMSSFRRALLLPGWSERSIWGYDEMMDTYFAQLWRDDDPNDDEPTIWISGIHPIGSPGHLAALIAKVTSHPRREVNVRMAGR